MIEERILRNMSYQTALNFAPAVPVRRNKPTPKSGRGGDGDVKSKSNKSPSSIAAAPSSPEHVQYDDGDDNHLKKSSANKGKGPSQLDALNYSDSDGEGAGAASAAIRRGSKLKERRRAAAAKLRRQKEAGKRSSGSFLEDTDDEDDGRDRIAKKSKETSQRKRLGGGGNDQKKKRRVIDDSDDDECDNDNTCMDDFIVDDEEDSSINGEDIDDDNLEEEDIIEPNKDKAHSKSADDNEISDDDDDEQPMSHAALAFQMQLNQQAALQEEDLLVEVMMANRSLSEDEAFRIWLEDLALQAEAHHKSTIHVSTFRQQKAASLIERPLCTRRESTLGSSAWRPDFRDELKHRALYRSFELHQLAVPDDVRHCGACGRSSHSITHRIEFSGPRYSADRTWQSSRDLKHTDWEACLGGRTTMDHGDKGSDDEDIEPKIFFVGGHCRARTELYHSLLHFKFLVFDEILGLLSGDHNVAVRMQLKANGQVLDRFLSKKKRGKGAGESDVHRPMSAEELMRNGGFVERQYERCRNLTEESEEKWGGHKGEMFKGGGRFGAPKRRKGQATVVSAGSGANGTSAGCKHQTTLTFN